MSFNSYTLEWLFLRQDVWHQLSHPYVFSFFLVKLFFAYCNDRDLSLTVTESAAISFVENSKGWVPLLFS